MLYTFKAPLKFKASFTTTVKATKRYKANKNKIKFWLRLYKSLTRSPFTINFSPLTNVIVNTPQALKANPPGLKNVIFVDETRVNIYLNNTIIPPVKSKITAKNIQDLLFTPKSNPTFILSPTNHTIIRLGFAENKARDVPSLNIKTPVNISIVLFGRLKVFFLCKRNVRLYYSQPTSDYC